MKMAALVFAVAGLVTAIIAALYWWASERLSAETPGGIPPVPEAENESWLGSALEAWRKASLSIERPSCGPAFRQS
jgi:hypothetical protein